MDYKNTYLALNEHFENCLKLPGGSHRFNRNIFNSQSISMLIIVRTLLVIDFIISVQLT